MLDLGGRKVELRFFGPANTTGDLALWDPRTRTLVTGDIVVAPTPYSFGSYHSEWIGVLDAMRALKPARIVPGHGPESTLGTERRTNPFIAGRYG